MSEPGKWLHVGTLNTLQFSYQFSISVGSLVFLVNTEFIFRNDNGP